jgi:hypothetical protein
MKKIKTIELQNSQIQLQKQNSLLAYTKNKDEVDIVKAQESELIKNMADPTLLIDIVANWVAYVGLPKSDVSAELIIISKFIYDNYSYLNKGEIELAYNMALTGKLEDVSYFGSFSPLYVGKVLTAYTRHRKEKLIDVYNRKNKKEMLEQYGKITSEEQVELTKQIISDFYIAFIEKGEIDDPFSLCYNYLFKNGFIKPTKEDVANATKWGNDKVESMKNSMNPFSGFKMNEELQYKRWARGWCVQNFFKTTDINVLLNNIIPSQFT